MTDTRTTQVIAEHWFTTSPDAQITIVVIEHWATVEEGPPPPEPSANNVRVMVLA